MPGSWSKLVQKNKGRSSKVIRVFKSGDKVNLWYFKPFSERYDETKYEFDFNRLEDDYAEGVYTKTRIDVAMKKWPEWYQSRIVEGNPSNFYKQSPKLYDWWLNILKNDAASGNRYYCMMILFSMAKKSGIPKHGTGIMLQST